MTTVKENLTAAATDALVNNALGKKWYESKMLWTNILAAVALAAQIKYGFVIDMEYQSLGLAFINVVLRSITKDAIVW